ncbi:sensor histidine kinase [Nannocystis punicea]|uniref:histidine kinase n=1 Tax=Nannocystis punicea TaxID=2995304 RepID=A0ABY7H389_9BACT|nr:HAMP domain-containing sensor histidine kinase [Nannocystis poenicansa]WAS93667.1 HAMP domain-containing sensor histidine kinase [Nannocystis poenicansa]
MNFVQQHRQQILLEWATEAGKAASARGLSDLELKNMMPFLLTALAGGADREKALGRHIESHLGDRIRRGFEMGEIVEEFAILQRCITDCARGSPSSERPSEEELARIFVTLQSVMVRTADVFQEHMRLDEQHEKRYLGLLRTLADQALRAPQEQPGSLTDRLQEAMQIVREATGADAAALLLYEPESRNLVTRAVAGDAAAQLREFAASVDLDSFTGQVAAHAEATVVDDVVTTELEVSDALRFSGIHSLLGVRLPRHRRFLGIMYIGLREARTFSSREIRRLEALGEGLTLHLDNAKLHAELRERLAEVETERKLRERFTAVLAHDLRGPLSTAKMSALLLKKIGNGAQRPELIDRIHSNLDVIDRMIHDLLDVGRLRAGQRLPLRIDWCDLRTLAEEVVEDLRLVHGCCFEVAGAHDVRGMWSRDELKRALWNLAENGIKYGTPDSPITLRVERRAHEAEIGVHNFGPAISGANREHIFDPFAHGRTPPRVGESWGLGLAVVRACAEAHGGSVSVTSDESDGTTFTMVLPLDARPYQPA